MLVKLMRRLMIHRAKSSRRRLFRRHSPLRVVSRGNPPSDMTVSGSFTPQLTDGLCWLTRILRRARQFPRFHRSVLCRYMPSNGGVICWRALLRHLRLPSLIRPVWELERPLGLVSELGLVDVILRRCKGRVPRRRVLLLLDLLRPSDRPRQQRHLRRSPSRVLRRSILRSNPMMQCADSGSAAVLRQWA